MVIDVPYPERTFAVTDAVLPFLHLQIDISKCHYLVDLDTMGETPREPKYSSNREEWISLAYRPFLDASRYVARDSTY